MLSLKPIACMRNDKIANLLGALSSKERKTFQKFLASPYFNSKEEYGRMFDIICEKVLKPEHSKYSEKDLWEELFPDKPYNQGVLRQHKSQLTRLFERFIEVEEGSSENFILRLKALNRLGLHSEYDKQFKRYYNKLKVKEKESGNLKYALFQLLSLHIGVLSARQRRGLLHLEEALGYLREFYEIEGWRVFCAELNQTLILKGSLPQWAEKLKANLGFPDTESPVLLRLYYLVAQSLEKKEDESIYFVFTNLLKSSKDLLSDDEQHFLYQYARNYCIRKLNQGIYFFQQELVDIFKEMKARGWLTGSLKLPGPTWKNMVLAYILRGLLDKAEALVEEMKELFENLDGDNYYLYLLGRIAFEKEDYLEAKKLCDPVISDLNDVFFGLDGRSLLARCHFELGNFDLAANLYSSFRVFLGRKKEAGLISDAHYKSYKLFNDCFNTLLKYWNSPAEIRNEKFGEVLQIILENDRFPSREWLLKKIKERME